MRKLVGAKASEIKGKMEFGRRTRFTVMLCL